MKRVVFVLSLATSIFFLACGDQPSNTEENKEGKFVALHKMNIESLEAEIKKREAALSSEQEGGDSQSASALMEAYFTYAERFSNRANSADRMFKAAELAMSLNHTVQAIKYFERVYDEYPKYEKRPYALFLKAFVLENQAQNYERAREVYEEFIQKYPGHDMADDAKYSLQNMGKSPEELIREFERQDSIRAAQGAA